MLDKKSIQVLKALNKAKNDLNYVCNSEELLKYLTQDFNKQILSDVLYYLKERGYITFIATNPISDICVGYEAQNYNEFSWLEVKNFLIKSILIPIGVSALTSLITLWISHSL